MNPVSTALFLVGYGLALPIGSRLKAVAVEQHRLAMLGHQVGVIVATLGWVVRGAMFMAFLHLLWLVGAGIWFSFAPRLTRRPRG